MGLRTCMSFLACACFMASATSFQLQGKPVSVAARAFAASCPASAQTRRSGVLSLKAIGSLISGLRGDNGEAAGNEAIKKKLLRACLAARNGLDGTGPMPQEEFDGLVDELVALNPTENPAESPLMGGRWQMVWTTEKEILFLLEKGLFGLSCTDVYQVIDPEAGTLDNSLDFEEDSFLRVGSSFNPEGDQFSFKFQSCALKWKSFEIPLPPVGAGTGTQVYLDNNLRIQRDTRGDTLIALRK